MSWGRRVQSDPVRKPTAGFRTENKMGYRKHIRSWLLEPEFLMDPNDKKYFGMNGLTASEDKNRMPTLRTSRSEPGYVPKVRYGGVESYSFGYNNTQTNAASKRCYRVMSYFKENNRNVLVDISDGSKIKDYGDKINHNVVVFDSERSALTEKFAPNQFHATRGGNGLLPRVLVAFECSGMSTRRNGGGSTSYLYENAKYMGIIKCLDPVDTCAQKHCRIPNPPAYFPPQEKCQTPRLRNSNFVRVNRRI